MELTGGTNVVLRL
ncbi:MAG: hypothetical protein LH603_16885 [Pseudonocardia sp.]|nr:hypothetical protein [Pseudonocardia sp.]